MRHCSTSDVAFFRFTFCIDCSEVDLLHIRLGLSNDLAGENEGCVTRELLAPLGACDSRKPSEFIALRISPAGVTNDSFKNAAPGRADLQTASDCSAHL